MTPGDIHSRKDYTKPEHCYCKEDRAGRKYCCRCGLVEGQETKHPAFSLARVRSGETPTVELTSGMLGAGGGTRIGRN